MAQLVSTLRSRALRRGRSAGEVSSRRQTRLTALDIVAFMSADPDEDPKQFCKLEPHELEYAQRRVTDASLKDGGLHAPTEPAEGSWVGRGVRPGEHVKRAARLDPVLADNAFILSGRKHEFRYRCEHVWMCGEEPWSGIFIAARTPWSAWTGRARTSWASTCRMARAWPSELVGVLGITIDCGGATSAAVAGWEAPAKAIPQKTSASEVVYESERGCAGLWIPWVDPVHGHGATRALLPGLAKWVDWTYGSPSHLIFGAGKIESSRGVTQGDPLAPLLFSLVLHRAVAHVRLRVAAVCPGALDICVFCLDDGLIAGTDAAVAWFTNTLCSELAGSGLAPSTLGRASPLLAPVCTPVSTDAYFPPGSGTPET